MYKKLFFQESFWAGLLIIDEKIANIFRLKPCSCGGNLHVANYPRKPRGLPQIAEKYCSCRFSFCCGWCRIRATPPTVRFLGQKVYTSFFVILISFLGMANIPPELMELSPRTFSLVTFRRWSFWWENVPFSRIWKKIMGVLSPNVHNFGLPKFLMAQFDCPPRDVSLSINLLLKFLSPISERANYLSTVHIIQGKIDDS